MEITRESLEMLYAKAKHCALAKFGETPDEIRLEDGYIEAVYINYCCGDRDVNSEIIYIEDLAKSTEELIEEQRIKEEKERIRKEEEFKRAQETYLAVTKEQRRKQYLELQKEFDVPDKNPDPDGTSS